MPTFANRLRDHGPQTHGWWDGADPPTAVSLSAAAYVGVRVQFTVPGKLLGASVYIQSGFTFRLWCLVNHTTTSDLDRARAAWTYAAPSGDQWRNVWLTPQLRIVPGDDYNVMFLMHTVYFRQNGLLGSPVVRNSIRYISSFQTTSIDPTSIAPTMNTNANGVDVLFRPD